MFAPRRAPGGGGGGGGGGAERTAQNHTYGFGHSPKYEKTQIHGLTEVE